MMNQLTARIPIDGKVRQTDEVGTIAVLRGPNYLH